MLGSPAYSALAADARAPRRSRATQEPFAARARASRNAARRRRVAGRTRRVAAHAARTSPGVSIRATRARFPTARRVRQQLRRRPRIEARVMIRALSNPKRRRRTMSGNPVLPALAHSAPAANALPLASAPRARAASSAAPPGRRSASCSPQRRPRPPSQVAARVAERAVALQYDAKATVPRCSKRRRAVRRPRLIAALNDTLTAITAVQINVLNAQNSTRTRSRFRCRCSIAIKARRCKCTFRGRAQGRESSTRITFRSRSCSTPSLGTVAIDVQTAGRVVSVTVKTEGAPAASRSVRRWTIARAPGATALQRREHDGGVAPHRVGAAADAPAKPGVETAPETRTSSVWTCAREQFFDFRRGEGHDAGRRRATLRSAQAGSAGGFRGRPRTSWPTRSCASPNCTASRCTKTRLG